MASVMPFVKSRSSVQDSQGSAIVEFVVFGLAGLMPMSFLLTGILTLQTRAFTAESAVREATRAFVHAQSDVDAFYLAQQASDLVFRDAALAPVPITISCTAAPCLSPTGTVRVRIAFPVSLGVKTWTIHATHEEKVDPWA